MGKDNSSKDTQASDFHVAGFLCQPFSARAKGVVCRTRYNICWARARRVVLLCPACSSSWLSFQTTFKIQEKSRARGVFCSAAQRSEERPVPAPQLEKLLCPGTAPPGHCCTTTRRALRRIASEGCIFRVKAFTSLMIVVRAFPRGLHCNEETPHVRAGECEAHLVE